MLKQHPLIKRSDLLERAVQLSQPENFILSPHILPQLVELKLSFDYYLPTQRGDFTSTVVDTTDGLIQLISEYLSCKFHTPFYRIHMHYKLTAEEFKGHILKIENLVKVTQSYGNSKVVVFVDELNATSILGLVKEVFVDNSIDGNRLHPSVLWVGAMNPPGGAFNLKSPIGSFDINTTNLPDFIVRTVPPSFSFLTLHFNPYTKREEDVYISKLLSNTALGLDYKKIQSMKTILVKAQEFIRSAKIRRMRVSIRDIQSCLMFRIID